MKKILLLVVAAYVMMAVAKALPSTGLYALAIPGMVSLIAFYLWRRGKRGKDGSAIARTRQAARAVRWRRMTCAEASRHYGVSETAIRRFNYFSFLYLE